MSCTGGCCSATVHSHGVARGWGYVQTWVAPCRRTLGHWRVARTGGVAAHRTGGRGSRVAAHRTGGRGSRVSCSRRVARVVGIGLVCSRAWPSTWVHDCSRICGSDHARPSRLHRLLLHDDRDGWGAVSGSVWVVRRQRVPLAPSQAIVLDPLHQQRNWEEANGSQ